MPVREHRPARRDDPLTTLVRPARPIRLLAVPAPAQGVAP
ncbi:hypothetical protein SLNWT_5626 [Streptomyces albus]|uniref:Uncharacterized protein n=1 Tax=Streptomyces albus (strain ATCC 21838 / DSM 41398 / FERM P-419 / JCM 4703 / NBRC 107858) TaxID=1081613 RepID=A0A0B5F6P4_STRA4|nr:hypothetical protein SLNWT_5626 [Streptomyces albus]AOU80304.1 hypothetical protein SLNHY_5613 [Streptomyces albus]